MTVTNGSWSYLLFLHGSVDCQTINSWRRLSSELPVCQRIRFCISGYSGTKIAFTRSWYDRASPLKKTNYMFFVGAWNNGLTVAIGSCSYLLFLHRSVDRYTFHKIVARKVSPLKKMKHYFFIGAWNNGMTVTNGSWSYLLFLLTWICRLSNDWQLAKAVIWTSCVSADMILHPWKYQEQKIAFMRSWYDRAIPPEKTNCIFFVGAWNT
jgi:hypothetical protein